MNLNSCWSTYSVVTIFSTISSQRFWMEFFLSPGLKVNCSSGGRLRAALWLRQKTGRPAGGNMKRLHDDDGDEEQSDWGAEDGTRKHRDDNNDATASKATEAAEDTDNVHLPCELAHISEPPHPTPHPPPPRTCTDRGSSLIAPDARAYRFYLNVHSLESCCERD